MLSTPAISTRTWVFLGLAALLIALRFLHFGPIIDRPHDWRQCDTANYIYDYYENGIDLLHPSVCWMGGHKTTILEFPLVEAIVAVLYKAFGPSLFWARLVFLAFFLGAAFYLYRIVRLLGSAPLAEVVALIYMAMPLGIFYSRAIHIDFAATCMAHGMAFHFMLGLRRENLRHLLFGSLWGSLAFLTKAPYAFFLAAPVLAFAINEQKLGYALRRFYCFLAPILLFLPWQHHVHQVNSAAPDWYFIPDYKKFVNKWGWYFGTWEMRGMGDLYVVLWERLRYEVLGSWGHLPMFVGLLLGMGKKGNNVMRIWMIGAVAYVFLFFNLNLVHNYYQIPLMAPAAFFLGLFLFELGKWTGKWRLGVRTGLPLFLVVAFAVQSVRLSENWKTKSKEAWHFETYFTVSQVPVQAGKAIQEMTPKGSLLIITYGGLDPRAPMLLYRARRNGWSIPQKDLTPTLVKQLMQEGATHLALVFTSALSPELTDFLGKLSFQERNLEDLGKLVFVYDLHPK